MRIVVRPRISDLPDDTARRFAAAGFSVVHAECWPLIGVLWRGLADCVVRLVGGPWDDVPAKLLASESGCVSWAITRGEIPPAVVLSTWTFYRLHRERLAWALK